MFKSKFERTKERALIFSYTLDLTPFSQEELCEIYCSINSHRWDERLGAAPKYYDSKYGFCYSCAAMDRIADRIGDKAVSKWWNVNYTQHMSEQEYEDWYEKRLQRVVLH